MKSRYDGPDDFEAEITIFTEEEGGRTTPPRNGIRWDFMYPEDRAEDSRIWKRGKKGTVPFFT